MTEAFLGNSPTYFDVLVGPDEDQKTNWIKSETNAGWFLAVEPLTKLGGHAVGRLVVGEKIVGEDNFIRKIEPTERVEIETIMDGWME